MALNVLQAGETLYPALASVDLAALCCSDRFQRLDKLEAYYRCTQYDDRRYTWDGKRRGVGGESDLDVGWYVPLRLRRPTARYDLPRLIVDRLTSMVFGAERFPQLVVEGDENAQDYVRELAREARLNVKIQEARTKGGSQGASCLSFGFVDGKPRISVHNAKHVTVLRWADRYLYRPAAALEAYSYKRTVYDSITGRSREALVYFARYWDETEEVVWEPISEEIARVPGAWAKLPSVRVEHGLGFCPVYWIQNRPDADGVDGDSDYEGQTDRCDEMNTLLSATGKGTVANVDPTLVILDDPQMNGGSVRKGSDNAIYSKGGAQYLELRGDSLKAALLLLAEHKQQALDTAGVVLGDPSMAGKAASAAALRVLYLPMINEADRLREQYGHALCVMMRDMLRAAKMIGGRAPGEIVITPDGQRLQRLPAVTLDPRVENDQMVKRVPGNLEAVTINWPPYFPNSWADTKSAVDALVAASGSKSIISRRTAVENIAPLFGIADVNEELEALDNDKATDIAFAAQAMRMSGGDEKDEDEDDDSEGGAGNGSGFNGERQNDGED